MQGADRDEVRAAVVARYAGLARAARAGQRVTDCDPGEFAAGGFGPAGYPDVAACRRARCGPAWAAATRSRWRTCAPGRRCWTWAAAAGSTCCSRRAGSARPGERTAWT